MWPKHKLIDSISDISHLYDVFFIDLWGVTHNGKEPFPGAIEAYERLKEHGKTLIILSNAPRMPSMTRQRLESINIDSSLFDDIFTSGYECHLALKNRTEDFYKNLGRSFYHIGPSKDESTFNTLNYTHVPTIEKAEFILLTGTDGFEKTIDNYMLRLDDILNLKLPLVCANADKTVCYGNDMVVCSGAIAKAYCDMWAEKVDGIPPVRIHGKPFKSMYASAHQLANRHRQKDIPLSRIVMLGDSLATDIKGANTYGIDSVLTLTGVHRADAIDSLPFDFYQSCPTYVIKNGIR